MIKISEWLKSVNQTSANINIYDSTVAVALIYNPKISLNIDVLKVQSHE